MNVDQAEKGSKWKKFIKNLNKMIKQHGTKHKFLQNIFQKLNACSEEALGEEALGE